MNQPCTECLHVSDIEPGVRVRCRRYLDGDVPVAITWPAATSLAGRCAGFEPAYGTVAITAALRPEPAPAAEASPATKDTNPKDGIGATKLPLHMVPPTAVALASLAHLDGALKYGKWNWRKAGVRASIYLDACRRHLSKWESGEELDGDSGLPHLAHALACLNILVDARACGKLSDDRPPSVDLGAYFDELTPHVQRLTEKHADRKPYHYSIADSEVKP